MATPGNKGFYTPGSRQASRSPSCSPRCSATRSPTLLPPEAARRWGWRIPFFIGCAIVPFLYMLRRSLQETEEFAARNIIRRHGEIFATLAAELGHRARRHGMVIMTTVSFYMITVYTPTFGKRVLS